MLSGKDGFRLRTLPNRRLLVIYGACLVTIALLAAVGLLIAPERYGRDPVGGYLKHQISANRTTFTHRVGSLSSAHFNGQWWFYVKPIPGPSRTDLQPFEVTVNVTAWTDPSAIKVLHDGLLRLTLKDFQCGQGTCRRQLLISQFYAPEQNIEFQIAMPAVSSTGDPQNLEKALVFDGMATQFVWNSHTFWVFELCVRWLFIVFTVVVLALFSRAVWLSGFCQPEQRFVFALLFTLFWFNNPLFMMDLLADSWVWPTLNRIFIFTYVCMLLLVLLVFSHGVIVEDHVYSFVKFYLPKFLLVATLWVLNICLFVSLGLGVHNNSEYADYTEYKAHLVINTLSCITFVLYLFHLLYVVCRILEKWTKISAFTPRFRALWTLSMVVLLFTWGALLLVIYEHDSAAEFLVTFGLYNLFTYLLALFYSPPGESDGVARFLHSRFGELDDDGPDDEML